MEYEAPEKVVEKKGGDETESTSERSEEPQESNSGRVARLIAMIEGTDDGGKGKDDEEESYATLQLIEEEQGDEGGDGRYDLSKLRDEYEDDDEVDIELDKKEDEQLGDPDDDFPLVGGDPDTPYQVDESTYTYKDIYKVKMRWIRAAIEIVQGHIDYMIGGDDLKDDYLQDWGLDTLLEDLNGRLTSTQEEMEEFGSETLIHDRGGLGLDKTHMRGVYGGKRLHWGQNSIMDLKYPDQLTTLIATRMGMQWAKARGLLKDGFIKSLNAEAWIPIIKKMRFDNGKVYTSSFVPINKHFDQDNFGEYGETGNSSMSPRISTTKDDPHKELEDRTTNMWLSQYKSEEGKVLFEAFRSGTLAYTFQDLPPERRKEIAQNKATDLFKAVVLQHINEKLSPEERIQAIEGDLRVDIDFASINLQTPGTIGFLGAESTHVNDEWEALTAFQGPQTFQLAFGGVMRDINVNLNVIALNFGVNSARELRGFDSKAGQNQQEINEDDDHGIPALKDMVDGYIEATQASIATTGLQLQSEPDDELLKAKLGDDNDRLGKVQGMWKQIEKGWKSGGTLYEMPALVANLMFMMGKAVHFNCKSGKDRTGFMDVESKFLAQQMEETGSVPKYKNKLKGQDKKTQRKLLFESGNLEVQEQNTAAKGYKIAPMRIMEGKMWERVGKDLNMAQGLGDLTTVKGEYKQPKKKDLKKMKGPKN